MKRHYPPVPLSWAQRVTDLTANEVAFGTAEGLLAANDGDSDIFKIKARPTLEERQLAETRDVLFRLLIIHVFKNFFVMRHPLQALEFLVRDFDDCPTAAMGNGRLLSGIAGISDGSQTSELEPEYFAQKVRTSQWLSEFVIQIIRDGVRKNG